MTDVINFVTRLLGEWGYFIVFGLAAVDNFGLPAAGDVVLLVAAGLAAESDRLEWHWVVLVGFLGGSTADNLSYAIGRYGAGPIVRRVMPRRMVDGVQQRLENNATRTIVSARMLAGLRSAVPVMAGTSRMRYRRFLLWNTIGVMTWAVVVGSLGFVFARSLPQVAELLQQGSRALALVVVGAVTLAIIIGVVRHWRRQAAAGADEASGGQPDVDPSDH